MREARVEATYRFPTWLFRRMFYPAAAIRGSAGPEVTLQPLRLVAPSAPIFLYAVQGNLAKIQDLFSWGLASPYDVASNSNGRTPLHYAANYNRYSLTQFPLDKGANPSVRDADTSNTSTVSLLWNRVFGNLFNEQREVDAWRCMLDDEDHLETRAFPSLLKIILELSTSQDTDGYTALIWAAARGDDSAVSVLLDFAANPNLANKRQQTALHMAAQGHNPRVIKIMRDLVRSGAEADPFDFWRRTPLLYAAAEQDFDDPAFLEPVLETHKVNLDVQDVRDRTPLGYAAPMGRPKTVRVPLDTGADPTIAANWSYTPAIDALIANHHECLEVSLEFHRKGSLPLLMPGVDIIGGRNVLHLLAEHADAATVGLFQRYLDVVGSELDLVDPKSKSEDDLRPDDCFMGRDEVDDKTTAAWNELLRHAKELIASPSPDNSSVDECEEAKGFL
ncbi:hypothetical protein DL765_000959 [Monosporascus sp. GIB2]|nr:hypothetical protein DL765_000959 [Monosporascus sp. GIB2]